MGRFCGFFVEFNYYTPGEQKQGRIKKTQGDALSVSFINSVHNYQKASDNRYLPN
jgi:hypothetical protein